MKNEFFCVELDGRYTDGTHGIDVEDRLLAFIKVSEIEGINEKMYYNTNTCRYIRCYRVHTKRKNWIITKESGDKLIAYLKGGKNVK